ncbi:class III extradiol ring-cleavage dioxygenase [Vibrio sp. PP-XX7]
MTLIDLPNAARPDFAALVFGGHHNNPIESQEQHMAKLPTYFISHGGGPWPWVPEMRSAFTHLEASLKAMVSEWETPPKAILMISGHWESNSVAIMASPQPPMVYDYYGFPAETYEITYPAPGAPDLAQRSLAPLTEAGIPAHLDHQRGFDHGTLAPLAVMFPEANVPVFQISLLKSYDPAVHIGDGAGTGKTA